MTFIKLGNILSPPFVGLQDSRPTPRAVSFLGTPVLDKIIFMAPNLAEFDYSILELYEVIIGVHQPKNIVKTQLAGANGTVKEYIGLGDYQISVTGRIVSQTKDFRDDETILQFMQWMEYPGSFDIRSGFLNLFGITHVVVEDFNITQVEGMRNVVPFRLEMCSDETETLIIKEDEL